MGDLVRSLLSSALSVCCCVGGRESAVIAIGTHQYRVKRQLGEGGFSLVLLVEDLNTGAEYAAKKIICQHGTDSFAKAQHEIGAYRAFRHRGIISLADAAVLEDIPAQPLRSAAASAFAISSSTRRPVVTGAKTVYMLFPVYKRGNLLDLVMHNQETERTLDEAFVIGVFSAVCDAVRYLHTFNGRLPDCGRSRNYSAPQAAGSEALAAAASGARGGYVQLQGADDSTQPSLPPPEALMASATPYAHRDIKLANVMLADDGHTPVLMDFGSVAPARYTAHTRSEALRIQDDAAENCTMSYRAPELFEVQTGAEFDERTDVWSLGCFLFALAYGYTPFEDPAAGQGASIVLAAINRKYSVPASNSFSPRLKQLVDFMLEPDPKRRPFIDQVIAFTDNLYPAT
ncbi:Serine/threonine-protein kinase env7 [Coemansia thaxteri]|uniref:non-specific serine/threonine protein kinase n=1 Tax=Coemansia thaxteri TaxID=2663907 RepID=A0A9W8EE52_9FUNG|nr:Serine/threonine-protein kinase env7 [Coemansia thaxteri]KAJ2009019.1 Serine/threonine-protein kinase env7 [Coemansia thaxteri]KAJ2473671.1 Serine/threonine-protein kinase env7 [Coemansia sp. RSA 2322]KAJ2478024.1 Serine/threonine-protein kinase env7 [Coemansia sp. RSA 2320]